MTDKQNPPDSDAHESPPAKPTGSSSLARPTNDACHFKSVFLRRAWAVIMQERTAPVSKWQLHIFIPARIFNHLPEIAPVDDLVGFCERERAIEEAYQKTAVSLNRDWGELTAHTKKDLVSIIRELGIHGDFPVARLSADDEEALTIRWDVADVFFAETKRVAVEECSTFGLDIGKREFSLRRLGWTYKDHVEEIIRILCDLLKCRVDNDLAVVILGTQARYKYYPQIKGRLRSEFTDIATATEEALVNFLIRLNLRYPAEKIVLTNEGRSLVSNSLEPLERKFIDLCDSLATTTPSKEVFSQAKELIGEPHMSVTYNVTGDGNVIDNWGTVVSTINKTLANKSEDLAKAFALLKAEIPQIKDLNEETRHAARRAVEKAENEAADKDPNANSIEEHLKHADSLLRTSGQVFDETAGWGRRLVQLAPFLTAAIPAAWAWLSHLATH